jgi:hypothetical protein
MLESETRQRLPRWADRPVTRETPSIEVCQSALKLYDRAKKNLEPGTTIVLGPDTEEVGAVLLQLRHRAEPRFDHREYLSKLEMIERLHHCPHSCFAEGRTPSQEFYTLLFEFPDDRFSVRIHAAIFLRGWEEHPLFAWCHERLTLLARTIIEEDDDGIAFSRIPKHKASTPPAV